MLHDGDGTESESAVTERNVARAARVLGGPSHNVRHLEAIMLCPRLHSTYSVDYLPTDLSRFQLLISRSSTSSG
jgi:hypothetical protein